MKLPWMRGEWQRTTCFCESRYSLTCLHFEQLHLGDSILLFSHDFLSIASFMLPAKFCCALAHSLLYIVFLNGWSRPLSCSLSVQQCEVKIWTAFWQSPPKYQRLGVPSCDTPNLDWTKHALNPLIQHQIAHHPNNISLLIRCPFFLESLLANPTSLLR